MEMELDFTRVLDLDDNSFITSKLQKSIEPPQSLLQKYKDRKRSELEKKWPFWNKLNIKQLKTILSIFPEKRKEYFSLRKTLDIIQSSFG